jgi:arabinose-5-phosphate isomerase
MQNQPDILAIAKKAIINQTEAVSNLINYINADFEKVITLIYTCKGRLVLCGIGKSAIVAQKIVSTLNSTGTPALYMHAVDAVHGDLGMVQENDIVIIISKSGESPEIKTILPLIKNFGNIIIGLVGNTNSFLAQNSNFIINTTIQEEACPIKLAPTTSTTTQMVMGDVLAICLMQLKGFQSADFAKYHPGGALGKKLYLTVGDLYADNEKPMVLTNASFKEVIVEISKKRLGATAVVDNENKLIGIITDGDIRRALEKYEDIKSITALDMVNKNAKTITENKMAVDALAEMKKNDINQLLVVKENQYLGIIHLHEIIKEGIVTN